MLLDGVYDPLDLFGTDDVNRSECDAEVDCREEDVHAQRVPSVPLDEVFQSF